MRSYMNVRDDRVKQRIWQEIKDFIPRRTENRQWRFNEKNGLIRAVEERIRHNN